MNFDNLIESIVKFDFPSITGEDKKKEIDYQKSKFYSRLKLTDDEINTVLNLINKKYGPVNLEIFKDEGAGKRMTVIFDKFVLRTESIKKNGGDNPELVLYEKLKKTPQVNLETVNDIFKIDKKNIFFVLTEKNIPSEKKIVAKNQGKFNKDMIKALKFLDDNNLSHKDVSIDNSVYIKDAGETIFKLIDYNMMSNESGNHKFRNSVKSLETAYENYYRHKYLKYKQKYLSLDKLNC